jgi:hypothetical protein
MLAPGRLGAWARRPIALVQGALAAVTLPLVVAGLGVCALLSPRRLLLVLLVPLYHLLTQAPLHYEPRYVLPMHALSLIVAAAAVAALAAVVSTVARSGRSRR